MNAAMWLLVVVVAAIVGWQVGARRARARYRRSLGGLIRSLRAGETGEGGRGEPPEVAGVREALGERWTSTSGERESTFLEVLGRLSRYLRNRVELPLLEGLEDDGRDLRQAAEEALGGVEDLEFFLEDAGGHVETWNLTSLVQSVTREFTREWDAPVRMRSPDLSLPVRLNAEALKDALYLVLHNAGHHGSGGTVEVLVEREEGSGVIRVRDQGPGFGTEGLERAFEAFWTTDESALGLGLPHARRMVRGLGGDVEIRDREGGGAEVEVRVPLTV